MNQSITLSLEERTALGSRAVAKLRRDGYVPAVVYGHDVQSTSAMVPHSQVTRVFQQAGRHHPVELTLGDKTRLAMIKQVDVDPVKRKLRHIAFHVVKQNEKVETDVPIRVTGEGESPAEKAGLVLIKNVDVAQVAAFPRNLPDFVEVNGEKLVEPGDSLTIADIKPIEGVEVLSEPTQVIISAVEPAALAAANDAAGGDAEVDAEVPAENGGEGSTEGGEGEGQAGAESAGKAKEAAK